MEGNGTLIIRRTPPLNSAFLVDQETVIASRSTFYLMVLSERFFFVRIFFACLVDKQEFKMHTLLALEYR